MSAIKNMGEQIKTKLAITGDNVKQMLDINEDGVIDKYDAKEYAKKFAEMFTAVLSAYTLVFNIENPLNVSPAELILLGIVAIAITAGYTAIVKRIGREKNQKIKYAKKIVTNQTQYAETIEQMKLQIQEKQEKIQTLREEINIQRIYNEFQQKIIQTIQETIDKENNQNIIEIIKKLIQKPETE